MGWVSRKVAKGWANWILLSGRSKLAVEGMDILAGGSGGYRVAKGTLVVEVELIKGLWDRLRNLNGRMGSVLNLKDLLGLLGYSRRV